jgi:hypothetical protein
MAEAVGQMSSKVGPITSTLASYSSFKNNLDAAKDAGEISEEDWLEGM